MARGRASKANAVVWSREAHTDDVWPFGFPGTRVARTLRERVADARRLLRDHPDWLPTTAVALCDTLDNAVGEALRAWPTRLLTLRILEDGDAVIEEDGRVEDKETAKAINERRMLPS